MHNLRSYLPKGFAYLMLSFMWLGLTQCTSHENVDLTGIWVGDKVDFINYTSDELKNSVIQNMSMHINSILELKSDGSFEVTNEKRTYTGEGTYWIEVDQLYVLTAQDTIQYTLKNLNTDSFIVEQQLTEFIDGENSQGTLQLFYKRKS